MLCGSFAFACMGSFSHSLGEKCDWQVILLARALLPLVFAAGLALAARVRFVIWRPRTLWLRSIAGSLSMVCMFYSFPRLPVADVFTLNNTFPIWVAILAWPVLGEPPTPAVWISVASGVLGVFLIQQTHIGDGDFTVLVAFASSFLTAVALIGLHRLGNIDPRAIVVHFSAVALLICPLTFLLVDRDASRPSTLDALSLLLLLGVGVSATVGQLFLTKAFAAGAPARVAVVGLTQIVFSMFLDVTLFQRSFNWLTLVGIALVVIPAAWVMTHPVRTGTGSTEWVPPAE
jgi:drug/metabolite transporter (DMT)-like permease